MRVNYTALVPVPLRGRAAVLLRHAADVIEVNGWHRGDYYDDEAADGGDMPAELCPVCALGAVSVAAFDDPEALARVIDDLERHLFDDGALARLESEDSTGYWAAFALAETVAAPEHHSLTNRVAGWNDAKTRTAVQVTAALRRAADKLTAPQ